MELNHIGKDGFAKMVEIGDKQPTERRAIAEGFITMMPETLTRVKNGDIRKGDVLAIAQVAGIMGSKKTSEFIPLCHNINLEGVDISFNFITDTQIKVTATVSTTGKTGVEMDALTAVSVSLLTIYDMVKAIDKSMVISDIVLVEKTGGKSGTYKRSN